MGEHYYNTQHGTYRLVEGEHILFDQTRDKSIKTTRSSSVLVHIDLPRLNGTINAMNGSAPDNDNKLKDEGSLVLPLFMCGISFNQIFHNIFNQIDQLNGQPQALAISGIDEIIYRTVVLMMNKNLLEDHHINDRKDFGVRTEIRRLCDYLKTHLEDPINLTTMEKVSGLSSRSLQYGFRKYFGCRPCEWLRNERLNLAKIKLTSSNDNMNITTLVYDLGFPSASLFSKYYKEKFGEKPSETLARKKLRMAKNTRPETREHSDDHAAPRAV
jgi:AraC-like DNA-binding protein